MYSCVSGIDFVAFYDFSIDFETVVTVCYFVFHLIKTVELSECGKIMSLQ